MSSNLKLKREGVLFLLCGPAGGGKTTVGERLIAESGGTMTRSISSTTRKPRAGEVDGRDYYFMTREDFLARKERGEFFETEEIHGNLYGTQKAAVETAISAGRDLMLIIDIRGVFNVKAHYPKNAFSVFVSPPSFDELRRRVESRGSSSADDLEKRIATAKDEYRRLREGLKTGAIDYFVLNEDLEDAYLRVSAILNAERSRAGRISAAEYDKIDQ